MTAPAPIHRTPPHRIAWSVLAAAMVLFVVAVVAYTIEKPRLADKASMVSIPSAPVAPSTTGQRAVRVEDAFIPPPPPPTWPPEEQ